MPKRKCQYSTFITIRMSPALLEEIKRLADGRTKVVTMTRKLIEKGVVVERRNKERREARQQKVDAA